jgi:hypothetical protein
MKKRLQAMRLVTCGLLVVVTSFGCAGYREVNQQPPSSEIGAIRDVRVDDKTSPCRDSLYLVLKSRPLTSLSDREYQYFLQKDQQCAEYRKHPNEGGNVAGALVGGVVLGLVLAVVLIASSMSHGIYWY